MRMRGGTARDQSRASDGATVAAVAKMLGTPLLPWQRYVADVAGEIDPATGTYWYDTVVLSTPRQCGKSTLVDAKDTRNVLWGPGRYVYYLAQTGKDAGEHFKKYLARLGDSPMSAILGRPYLGAGSLRQPFFNGSVIMPMSVTKVSGHGVQGDMITMDEAFSLSMETGNAIVDGFLPTTATRMQATGVRPQLWITSTEGTAESTFFNARLDECRAGGQAQRTCWFDFGVPDDADVDDLDVVMQWHPAAGILWDRSQLVDFRAQFGTNRAGWARAYGNRRDVGVADRVIPLDLWESSTAAPIDPATLDGSQIVMGVAVDVDATHTSVAAGITRDDGTTLVQLVRVFDGTGGVAGELERLCRRYGAAVCMDSKGPNQVLHEQIEANEGIDMVPVSATDYMGVGQAFVTGLGQRTIAHAVDDDLDLSAANCARKWAGDAWRITRRGSTGLTSPLESCMMAAWGATHRQDTTLQIF